MITMLDPRRNGVFEAIITLKSHFFPDDNVERKSGEVSFESSTIGLLGFWSERIGFAVANSIHNASG